MMGDTQRFFEMTATTQSWGMVLSEWADAQPEPWATAIRLFPISAAFLLGLSLVLLWKRKSSGGRAVESQTDPETSSIQSESESKSVVEKEVPLLQDQLKTTLREGQRVQAQLAATKNALDEKEGELEKLRSRLEKAEAKAKAKSISTSGDEPVIRKSPASSTKLLLGEDLQASAAAAEKLTQAAVDFRSNSRPGVSVAGRHKPSQENLEAEIPGSWDELLLFRSTDPSIWNRTLNESETHRALSLEEVPSDAVFLRLRRLDNGEGVVIPIQCKDLTQDGVEQITGFNGSNEEFYGARHLGVYCESLPQEVEIRFAFGGWGFGHVPDNHDSDTNNKTAQACAWAGLKIDGEILFEITVFPSQPDLTANDQLIGPS